MCNTTNFLLSPSLCQELDKLSLPTPSRDFHAPIHASCIHIYTYNISLLLSLSYYFYFYSLLILLILNFDMAEPQRGGDHSTTNTSNRGKAKRVTGGSTELTPVSPCGACKFLRRKCISGCIFAPHFGSDQGTARFAAVHKVFGASNVSKLLLHIPMNRRDDAVVTISYEAQARLSDPVYGCVSTILALQQQVCNLFQ